MKGRGTVERVDSISRFPATHRSIHSGSRSRSSFISNYPGAGHRRVSDPLHRAVDVIVQKQGLLKGLTYSVQERTMIH